MKISLLPDGSIRLSGLAGGERSLLEQIPLHADPASVPGAAERLFPPPVREPDTAREEELNDDWPDMVLPGLQAAFASHIEIVAAAVKDARPRRATGEDETVWEIRIPQEHIEIWYSALNQARLVMQERWQFPDDQQPGGLEKILESESLRAWLVSRFYTQLQSMLLDLGMEDS